MAKCNESSSGGVSTLGLLQIALIVLKLCEVIDWSWLWVLAPMWTPALLLVVITILAHLLDN